MGWSCRAEAAETMNRINRMHSPKDGCYEFMGDRYFVEWSNREHDDGAITGKLMKMIGESNFAVRMGSVRIDPEGELVRAPSALKERMEELS